MYTDKINQSVAEAVKKVMDEELSAKQKAIAKIAGDKSKIDSADLSALRSGAKPVKEGWQDMLDDVKKRAGPQPNGGAGVKQGSRYGGSKQKDEPEDKMKKEEVEQIDELSKDTLNSYVKKSFSDKEKDNLNTAQRQKGLRKATSRLYKEDAEQIDEKHLTEPEMKKREEVVKSMKKGLAGFKQRYGERAKSVMYATATKVAKEKA